MAWSNGVVGSLKVIIYIYIMGCRDGIVVKELAHKAKIIHNGMKICYSFLVWNFMTEDTRFVVVEWDGPSLEFSKPTCGTFVRKKKLN